MPGSRPGWLVAHPYLRTYVAQYAAAGTQALAELDRERFGHVDHPSSEEQSS
jgi:hypothetical protein